MQFDKLNNRYSPMIELEMVSYLLMLYDDNVFNDNDEMDKLINILFSINTIIKYSEMSKL